MDCLRSCYETLMRDGQGNVFKARWYWTDQPPLDKEHCFGSHNWSKEEWSPEEDDGGPGEIWGATRKWYSGAPPIACDCIAPGGSDAAWLGEDDGSGVSFPGCLWGAEFDLGFDDSFLSETYVNELP